MDGIDVFLLGLAALFLIVIIAIWRKTPITAIWKSERGEVSIRFGENSSKEK